MWLRKLRNFIQSLCVVDFTPLCHKLRSEINFDGSQGLFIRIPSCNVFVGKNSFASKISWGFERIYELGLFNIGINNLFQEEKQRLMDNFSFDLQLSPPKKKISTLCARLYEAGIY